MIGGLRDAWEEEDCPESTWCALANGSLRHSPSRTSQADTASHLVDAMLCSLCSDIFRAPIEFKSRLYKKSVHLHRESAESDHCYMCDCIWRSFVGDDENVEPNDAADYFSTYRFIDQSATHDHPGLIALTVSFNHRSGRIGNPSRRYYPAFYLEPVTGQLHLVGDV